MHVSICKGKHAAGLLAYAVIPSLASDHLGHLVDSDYRNIKSKCASAFKSFSECETIITFTSVAQVRCVGWTPR